MASQWTQCQRILLLTQADSGSIPGLGRSPGGGNGNTFHLAWRIPWTEEPGRLQAMGSQRVGQDRVTEHTHKWYQETVYQIVSYNEDCSDLPISAVSGYLTRKSFDSHLNTDGMKLSLRGYSLIEMTEVIGQLSLCSDQRNRSLISKPRLKLVSNSTHENEDFWEIFLLF